MNNLATPIFFSQLLLLSSVDSKKYTMSISTRLVASAVMYGWAMLDIQGQERVHWFMRSEVKVDLLSCLTYVNYRQNYLNSINTIVTNMYCTDVN